MAAGIFPRLDTVTILVKDLETAKQWYEEKLELNVAFMGGEQMVVFDTGGPTSLTLWKMNGEDASGNAGSFPIFYTDDACSHRDKLMERGVHCDELQQDTSSCFFSFYDPDGNRLEACQY
jgi:catechol 2,3-dioxygenase-like lactoylglutathione lyase family enzyme